MGFIYCESNFFLVADIVIERGKVHGIKLRNGQFVKTKRGVVCNSNVWALPNLLQNQLAKLTPPQYKSLIEDNNIIIKTKSFTHLHLGTYIAAYIHLESRHLPKCALAIT